MPCDFCRERNLQTLCVKKRGPKTEARNNPPLALPTPDNAIMGSEDGLLFRYSCSDEYQKVGYYHFSRLVRKFVAGYGGILPSIPLRHAIIALAASSLPPSQFEVKKLEHMQWAIAGLAKKPAETIDDADLLTAYILWRTTRCKDEGLAHIKGMVAIMNILEARAG